MMIVLLEVQLALAPLTQVVLTPSVTALATVALITQYHPHLTPPQNHLPPTLSTLPSAREARARKSFITPNDALHATPT
jgi:negative regulator of sigma E activity